jgi:ubiquinone/menaquinone biosynthesis C-methylase UbiE
VNLREKRIFEIGCGDGEILRHLLTYGAKPENLAGVDLLQDRIESARWLAPHIEFYSGDAAALPFAEASFDLVCQITVFTSILDPIVRRRVAGEMLRVLKPTGLIFWYDFHIDNPSNPDVRGAKKEEIHSLFPNCSVDLRRVTLAPPLTRLFAPYSWLACYVLEKIPFLCTHYMGVIRKSRS